MDLFRIKDMIAKGITPVNGWVCKSGSLRTFVYNSSLDVIRSIIFRKRKLQVVVPYKDF
jgi:hypothetical protein